MRLIASLAAAGAFAALAACATMQGGGRDPYLWLEAVEGQAALDWVKAQNANSEGRLKGDPRYAQFESAALAILTSKERLATGTIRDGYVYNFWQDETHVRGIWRRSPLTAYANGAPSWETVFDLDAQAKLDNQNWVWKGADCQPNGVRCMVSLSNGGKDASAWAEFDLDRKSFVAGGFYVPEGKSSIAWKDADTLLVATNWGPGTMSPSGYPLVVKTLPRGKTLADATEVYRGEATDVGVSLSDFESEDGTRIVVATRSPTFFTNAFVRLDTPAPQPMALPPKSEIEGLHKGELIVSLQQDWTPRGAPTLPRGALISMTLDSPTSVKLIYGPGPREAVRQVAITRDAVLVAALRDVKGRILKYGYDGKGWVESQIGLPSGGTLAMAGASSRESTAFAVFEDFTRPSTLYAINARSGSARKAAALPAQYEAVGVTTQQFEATSKDGTKVPYFLVRKEGAAVPPEGAPTLLYGYGGFRLSQVPGYNPVLGKLWLERGGVYVVANIRGGGEFGPAWHEAGLKTKRQVIYDDFIAVAEDLIARKVTTPRRLGISGGSNGGLLMGVMLTQRPDLFRAAVLRAPLLDMLHYHELLAGASWIDEYGDPRVKTERAWLAKFSPYQNLVPAKAGAAEPLFITSTKDDRVHPGHARKLAARMAAAGAPFLYYENIDGGHSTTANQTEVARKNALEYTYLSQRLMD